VWPVKVFTSLSVPLGDLPEFDEVIEAGSGQQLAVRRNGDGVHERRVGFERFAGLSDCRGKENGQSEAEESDARNQHDCGSERDGTSPIVGAARSIDKEQRHPWQRVR